MSKENRFEKVVQMLSLHESDIYRGVLRTRELDGPLYLSSNPEIASAIKVFKFIRRIDDLKALIEVDIESDNNLEVLQPWPVENDNVDLEELSVCKEKQVYKALQAYLRGDQSVNSYLNIIKKRYFPMRVGVFAAEEIVIDSDHPLHIQGHDPVILNFKLVTLQAGGQIICEAPVIMTVDKFIKNN